MVRLAFRFILGAPMLTALILPAGCGEECSPEDVPVCEMWETPARIASGGEWEGTYNVDRYWIGDNGLYMEWPDFKYILRLKRKAHFWRAPFYSDGDIVNTGARGPNQTNFKVQYKPGEWWYFHGHYSVSGNETTFRGTIHTHGQWIGRFEMHRPRACLHEGTRTEEVCVDVIQPFFYSGAITDDASESTGDFEIHDVLISPNPVTTGGKLHILAEAAPVGMRAWSVWIAPSTLLNAKTSLLRKDLRELDFYADPPTVVGEYRLGIDVSDGTISRIRSFPLSVTAP